MNAEPKHNQWQLSLANVLVFVIAVAIWMGFITRGDILSQRPTTYAVFALSLIAILVARHKRQRAVGLLILLFMLIVGGSHAFLSYRHLGEMRVREQRLATLYSIQMALISYSTDQNDFPSPSRTVAQSGAVLYAALMTKSRLGPYLGTTNVRTENGSTHLLSAFGARLLWARTPEGKWILVDTGPDNLPGGTLSPDGVYTPGPVDMNSDGINDGVDDLVVFPSLR